MSEACSIAIHAMVMLASNQGKNLLAKDIVSVLKVSETHLQKVMQRLAKTGFINSTRGPGGGFFLNKKGEGRKLIEIYEAIDGPFALNDCLFEKPVCDGKRCIFDKLLKKINRDLYKYLSSTGLKQLAKKNGSSPWKIL
jgi:Rrf2 family protein